MPEVTSAKQATSIAVAFLKQYYHYGVPQSAKKSHNTWTVLVNVGIVVRKIARLDIDAATGEITFYDVPDELTPPEKRP